MKSKESCSRAYDTLSGRSFPCGAGNDQVCSEVWENRLSPKALVRAAMVFSGLCYAIGIRGQFLKVSYVRHGLNIHCDPDVTLDQVQRNLTPSFESED